MAAKYPDIRIYSNDEGARKRKVFPVDQVESVRWDNLSLGGFGQCDVTFANSFDDTLDVNPGDVLEVWVANTLRYRGFIGARELTLDFVGRKTLTVYGLAERLNSILVEKKYIFPTGKTADLIAWNIYNDYIDRVLAFNSVVSDFQTCTTTLYKLDAGGSCRDTLDRLVEASGSDCVWGCDVEALNQEKIYLIPKDATTPKYRFYVGKDVKSYSYAQDATSIKNSVHVFGAKSKWPNLLSDPGFDNVEQTSELCGNLIANESFELKSGSSTWIHWTAAPAYPADPMSGAVAGDTPRTGNQCIKFRGFDAAKNYISQRVPVVGGETYGFAMYIRETYTDVYQFDVTITPNSGSATTTPRTNIGQLNAYNKQSFEWTAPEDATSAVVKIACVHNGHNLDIDDIAFWPVNGVGTAGWKRDGYSFDLDYNPTQFVFLGDPEMCSSPIDGGYVASFELSAGGGGATIILPQSQFISVDSSTVKTYKAAATCRLSAGGYGAVDINMWRIEDDGTYVVDGPQQYTVANADGSFTTGWLMAVSTDSNTKYVCLSIHATNNHANEQFIDIENVQLFEDVDRELDGEHAPEWRRGERSEYILKTTDSFIQDDEDLSTAVKASIATYGERQAEESVPYIDSTEDAQAWAKAYFARNAVPAAPKKLEIANCSQDVRCDGAVEVWSADQTRTVSWPVRVQHTLRAGADTTNVSIELDDLRPSFEGILTSILSKAEQQAVLAQIK